MKPSTITLTIIAMGILGTMFYENKEFLVNTAKKYYEPKTEVVKSHLYMFDLQKETIVHTYLQEQCEPMLDPRIKLQSCPIYNNKSSWLSYHETNNMTNSYCNGGEICLVKFTTTEEGVDTMNCMAVANKSTCPLDFDYGVKLGNYSVGYDTDNGTVVIAEYINDRYTQSWLNFYNETVYYHKNNKNIYITRGYCMQYLKQYKKIGVSCDLLDWSA
jgi:hypothetical protein